MDSSLDRDETEKFLEELGRRLQHAGRAEDTLAYLGGGSLAALLPGAAGPVEAAAAVGAILAAVSEPFTVTEHELFLSLSMGIAIYPSDGATAAELLRNADAAMHRASDEGGDRWEFFHSGMNAERRDRLALDAELHRALDGQFFLEYQPVVSTATEEIVAVEALVRWRHPERGIVPPLDFIPVAEDSGVLIPMGAWILSEACRPGPRLAAPARRPLRMSVNISARQLHERRSSTPCGARCARPASTPARSSSRSPRRRPCGSRGTRPRSSAPCGRWACASRSMISARATRP